MPKETKEDLEAVISSLSDHLDDMQEKLYEANIEPRPTIMQKIIDRENEVFNTIKYLINECEKETGRPVPFISYKKEYKDVSWDAVKNDGKITAFCLYDAKD